MDSASVASILENPLMWVGVATLVLIFVLVEQHEKNQKDER